MLAGEAYFCLQLLRYTDCCCSRNCLPALSWDQSTDGCCCCQSAHTDLIVHCPAPPPHYLYYCTSETFSSVVEPSLQHWQPCQPWDVVCLVCFTDFYFLINLVPINPRMCSSHWWQPCGAALVIFAFSQQDHTNSIDCFFFTLSKNK